MPLVILLLGAALLICLAIIGWTTWQICTLRRQVRAADERQWELEGEMQQAVRLERAIREREVRG